VEHSAFFTKKVHEVLKAVADARVRRSLAQPPARSAISALEKTAVSQCMGAMRKLVRAAGYGRPQAWTSHS
jgi:hypothetical protein